MIRTSVAAFCISLAMGTVAAQASFTIEGGADSVVVVAEQADRAEIVTALADRFGMEILGGEVAPGALDGRFAGTLGQVLKSILPENGYAIAYVDGKPARVTFTGTGDTTIPLAPLSEPAPPAAVPQPRQPSTEAEPPSLDSVLERQAASQFPSAAPARAEPAEDGDSAQMKEMTRRAVQELEALVRAVRQVER